MVADRALEGLGHQRGIACLLEQVGQTGVEFLAGGGVHGEAQANARGERPQIVVPQFFRETVIPGQDHGEHGTRIKLGTGEQAQFGKH